MKTLRGTVLVFALALAVAACESGGERKPPAKSGGNAGKGSRPAGAPAVPEIPHERFLSNPTVVKAETILVILPADYGKEVRTKGLSAGWREDDGRRIWEGSGEVEVRVRQLVLSGPSITVTLVADQPEPEVMIQAAGEVSFGHLAGGLSTRWEGKAFLMIRNDRWVER